MTKEELENIDDIDMLYDLLNKAYCAETDKGKIKYANKVLEMDKDNVDAKMIIVNTEKDNIKKLEKINKLLRETTKIMEKEGWFDEEYIGMFWGNIETRPYMRVRYNKVTTLIKLGRLTESIKECEDLIRLCESDNMAVRYKLLSLYVALERFDEAEKLSKKYNIDKTLSMLFPISVMYYKQGEYTKASKLIIKMNKENPSIIKLLSYGFLEDYLDDGIEIGGYIGGTANEAAAVLVDNANLLLITNSYIDFYKDVLKKDKKTKQTKTRAK